MHPFACYPASKHQNAASLALQAYEKSQWTFFYGATRAIDFSSRNNFTNLGSFAKIFVPVETTIP